jgi:hypothetical protein
MTSSALGHLRALLSSVLVLLGDSSSTDGSDGGLSALTASILVIMIIASGTALIYVILSYSGTPTYP